MKSKKRLICSICAVFMIAFSLFLIPFSKVNNASAETIPLKSYTSQVYQTAFGFNDYKDNPVFVSGCSFSFSTSNTDSFTFSFVNYGVNRVSGVVYDYLAPQNIRKSVVDETEVSGGWNFPAVSANDSGLFTRWYFVYALDTDNSLTGTSYCWSVYLQNPDTSQVFNSDVISIEYGGICRSSSYPNGAIGGDYSYEFPYSLINFRSYTNPMLTRSYNWIRFNDSIGNSFVVFIPFWSTDDMALRPFSFKHETVYYNNLTDNQIYDEGYNAGYGIGSTEGYDAGYNTGYNQGFTNGENTGYGNGYVEGLETASETTFLGLIGATIDAPIKAFRGLFNFELLGVNMVSLITGLFTLCVIVCIVKLVLGGK